MSRLVFNPSIRTLMARIIGTYRNIGTYIIVLYNPSVMIIGLVSHTTYVVCINFLYISGGIYSLKSTFHGNFIYFQSFCQKSNARKSTKKYFFCILIMMSGLGLEPWLYV